jgi:hypothetical protein
MHRSFARDAHGTPASIDPPDNRDVASVRQVQLVAPPDVLEAAGVLARWQELCPPGALTAFSEAFTLVTDPDSRRDRLAKKRKY